MLLDLTEVVGKKPESDTIRCGGQCKLINTCTAPIKPIIGTNGVLFIAENPTEAEDGFEKGFLGKASKRLKQAIIKAGTDPEECSYAYAVRCHGDYDKENIEACRILLLKTIKEINPHTIILLGQAAVSSIITWDYGKAAGALKDWVGFQIPSRRLNAWLCPNYEMTAPYYYEDDAMDLLYDQYIAKALKKTEHPWKEIPNESKEVAILSSEEAVEKINSYRQEGGVVAFDYETSGLKSEKEGHFIYCCSICYKGEETIVFMWDDAVEAAMKKFLRTGRVLKIASNMKYEHRWTGNLLDTKIKGWHWDTMLAAHVLDCRPNITSIKTQGYIRFGLPDYDSHIKKFFDSKNPDEKGNSNAINNIQECDQKAMLLYCGIDSLIEYKVAVDQMREMGYPWPSKEKLEKML